MVSAGLHSRVWPNVQVLNSLSSFGVAAASASTPATKEDDQSTQAPEGTSKDENATLHTLEREVKRLASYMTSHDREHVEQTFVCDHVYLETCTHGVHGHTCQRLNVLTDLRQELAGPYLC